MTEPETACHTPCDMSDRQPVANDSNSSESPVEDQLLVRCGALADLALDCLLPGLEFFRPTYMFTNRIISTASASLDWLVWSPLWRALQAGRAPCRCSPLGRLAVLDAAPSGSSAEGLSDLDMGARSYSDYDCMYEFGPCRWPTAGKPACHSALDCTGCIGPGAPPAPLLLAVPSASPGFVRLWQAPGPRCLHSTPLEFPADAVRRLMYAVQKMSQMQGDVTLTGPSAAVSRPGAEETDDIDNVPCLHLPEWPADEFRQRSRVNDFPPAAMREDICGFGVHLVPTGCRGSRWEPYEWRLSFSRAEIVANWHLTVTQRSAIKAVKTCRNALQFSGKRHLKSYFIKTAALWLCQDMPSDCWISVTRSARMILDRLEAAVATNCLPCFFWADVNLFKFLPLEEMVAISQTVTLMRSHMTQHLLSWCEERYHLEPILECPAKPLSERQLRSCLARALILTAVGHDTVYRPNAPCYHHWSVAMVPDLLRLSAVAALEWRHHHDTGATSLQHLLVQAMAVAPDDLMAGARLPPAAGLLVTWDVAPLLSLLTDGDLRFLLGQPDAVRAWCRQRSSLPPTERPAGLTAHRDSPDAWTGRHWTPRELADLLLNPQLRVRALCESVPYYPYALLEADHRLQQLWSRNHQKLPGIEECRQTLKELSNLDLGVLEDVLFQKLVLDTGIADPDRHWKETIIPDILARNWRESIIPANLARHWKEAIIRQLSGHSLQIEYDMIRTCQQDRWQLRQFAFTNNN